jgi:hypothetical protein
MSVVQGLHWKMLRTRNSRILLCLLGYLFICFVLFVCLFFVLFCFFVCLVFFCLFFVEDLRAFLFIYIYIFYFMKLFIYFLLFSNGLGTKPPAGAPGSPLYKKPKTDKT